MQLGLNFSKAIPSFAVRDRSSLFAGIFDCSITLQMFQKLKFDLFT